MIKATPDFEWTEYFGAAERGGLHHLLELLQPHLTPGLKVLDLGCGVGIGTIHLAKQGLEVTAVDAFPEALERLRAKMPPGLSVHLVQSDFRKLEFPDRSFDVIVAINSLYFLSPMEFASFWKRLTGWLKPGGLFVGNFMGPNDPWAYREDYNTQTEASARELFEGFELLHLHDDEMDTIIATGKPAHVHVVHAIARK